MCTCVYICTCIHIHNREREGEHERCSYCMWRWYIQCCQLLDDPPLGLVLRKSQQGTAARTSQAWRRQLKTVDHLQPRTGCLKLDEVTSWYYQGWVQKETTVGKQTLDSTETNFTSFFFSICIIFLLHSFWTLFLCLQFCSRYFIIFYFIITLNFYFSFISNLIFYSSLLFILYSSFSFLFLF